MLDKFKTLLSENKDVKKEEFEASQLAVASLMVTTALHDGEFDEIEKDEILKLLGNFSYCISLSIITVLKYEKYLIYTSRQC